MTTFFETTAFKIRSIPKKGDWIDSIAEIEAKAFDIIRENIEHPGFPPEFRSHVAAILHRDGVRCTDGEAWTEANGEPRWVVDLHEMFHRIGALEAKFKGGSAWTDDPERNLAIIRQARLC